MGDLAALEVRTLRAEDRVAFEPAVHRARDRGDLRASSDPEATFTLQIFAVDPAWFGAAFVDGEIVGFVMPDLKVAVVEPALRRRGVGRRLIEHGLTIQAAHGRAELFMGSVPEDPGGAAFLSALGFTFHSSAWDLDLPLDRDVPRAVWPDGVIARPFDRNRDVETLPAVINAAFADHPTPIVMEPEMFRASLDDPNILDEDALILEDGSSGQIVGFCLVDVRREGRSITSDRGEIAMVGVRPDRQGRGLGRQLLRAGATYLRGLGVPNVHLAVNGRNEGALGLYESEGYERLGTRDRWVLPVPMLPA